eukprot:CAMPEP_0114247094 /NCGR_PEP_ID=MMETSP0058-20121206/12836_1 /TAXON_ID=36894 /ORGANISM="Pyramimonas parkeae, CCMP726" /LENGTH=332 /DNA_ID=CAMNT_0001360371 /DNA_START=277 /DNA_END=1275 /DNA_ORIENTATION=-
MHADRRALTAHAMAMDFPGFPGLISGGVSSMLIKMSADVIVVMKNGLHLLDQMINTPWRPGDVWVPILYFFCLKPVLWYSFQVSQTLRRMPKEKRTQFYFTESFFGFLNGPLFWFGVSLAVNWFADTLVAAVTMADASTGTLINVLGSIDTMMYTLVFGNFLFRLQDYYLDEMLDMIFGRSKVDTGIQDLAHRTLEVGIIAATVVCAVQSIGASDAIFSGIYSLLGIGFGFAGQEVLKNFFGGLMLAIMRPFQIGDRVGISNPVATSERLEGAVISIGYYQIILIDDNGHPIFVPNSWFVSTDLRNRSQNKSFFKTRGYQEKAIKGTTATAD